MLSIFFIFFFFNDTATTEIYTLSLHDALPILKQSLIPINKSGGAGAEGFLDVKASKGDPHKIIITLSNLFTTPLATGDRKSTRLNSSHANISYAVFCLKKKKIK